MLSSILVRALSPSLATRGRVNTYIFWYRLKRMLLSCRSYCHIPFTCSLLIIIWTCLSCWSLKLIATPKGQMLAPFRQEVGNIKKDNKICGSTVAVATLIACFTLSCPKSSFGDNGLDYGATSSSKNAALDRTPRRAVLPQGTRSASGKDPILQGLVYFLDDPNLSLSPEDTLVVIAHRRPTSDKTGPSNMANTEIIAGAKIKLSKIRFPVLLNLYEENIINPSIWEAVSSKEDVYIDALICPAGDTRDGEVLSQKPSLNVRGTVPCTEEQSTFKAHGLAKLISNLPELPPEVAIRAAASLQLQ